MSVILEILGRLIVEIFGEIIFAAIWRFLGWIVRLFRAGARYVFEAISAPFNR